MMLSFCSIPWEKSRKRLSPNGARSDLLKKRRIRSLGPRDLEKVREYRRYSRAVIQDHTPRGCFSGTTPMRVRTIQALRRVALAEEPDLPRRGPADPQQHHDRCGLSGAIWAEEAVDLAPADLQVHTVHGGKRAESLRQATRFDHWLPAFTLQEVSV